MQKEKLRTDDSEDSPLDGSDGTLLLGRVAKRLMDKMITPRQAKFGAVFEVWQELLPEALARHCEIADIRYGQLIVKVDSPAHRYELQLCSSALLEQLQQRCPRARIWKIKLVTGSIEDSGGRQQRI